MTITQEITLDLSHFEVYRGEVLDAKQGDGNTRIIQATILDNGVPFKIPEGATVDFRCLKPDGCSCKYPAQIMGSDTISVELSDQALACPGRVEADICIYDAEGDILSTATFFIFVAPVPTGKAMNSSNEYLELVAVLKRADELVGEYETALDQLDDLIKTAVQPMEKRVITVETNMASVLQDIADLKYIPIEVISTGNNVSPVELGATINAVTVTWNLNRNPEAQTVDGIHVAPGDRSVELTGLGMTTNRTFTVEAVDERGAADSRSTTVYFYNGVYSGLLPEGGAIDSAAILSLTRKLQSGKGLTFTVDAGAGEQIAYALPARYGKPVFSVGGFEGGFYKAATIDFTNASGYTESYDVWLSDNAGLGDTTVTVK